MPNEWQVAVRNRRRNLLQPALQPVPYAAVIADHPQTQDWAYSPKLAHGQLPVSPLADGSAAVKRLQQQIETRCKEVTKSVFLHKFQGLLECAQRQDPMHNTSEHCKLNEVFTWEAAVELIVYGLGSPAAGARPVHCQLAFLVLLQTQLPSLKHTRAFDPVFTSLDTALLRSFNIEVLGENDSGKYTVTGPTLFYMPHCDCRLYNNLLKANWSPRQLCKIAILGNSFHAYAQRWALPSKQNSPDRPHELLAVSASGTAVELPVDEADFPVTSAFNDLSLHLFPEWNMGDQVLPNTGTPAGHAAC